MLGKTRRGHRLQGHWDKGLFGSCRSMGRWVGKRMRPSPSGRGGNERIVCQPHPRAARLPTPTEALTEGPATVMVGRPAPGIRRNPGITRAGIVGPCAAPVWIPARTAKVWPPHGAATSGGEAPVVIHI